MGAQSLLSLTTGFQPNERVKTLTWIDALILSCELGNVLNLLESLSSPMTMANDILLGGLLGHAMEYLCEELT